MATVTYHCINCNEERIKGKNSFGKYCDNACQGAYQTAQKVSLWLSGIEKGWSGKTRQLCQYVKKYLKETRGTECSMCGWDGVHPADGASLTEIDHIDGDAENCTPENLRIICPNCHSMTDTFRARNKNSKRIRN